ncbi:hypothetical protein MVEN_00199000 [Mycena venus]|uniref:DUF6534 domain-containing protein n=1 Tax=Mycena venus TaxID=2733690 RepID=A0A8H7DEN2_9AGAR|nr:hypothetical protein MVEN_00199000 [Mycena venus]
MDSVLSFNPHLTLGALQIGVLFSYALFGVTTTQTYMYYSRFPNDSSRLKALVAFIWVCEVAHALCIGHTLYIYTISDYVHPERLGGAVPKSLATATFFSGIIGASVQAFFSFRIYAFSNKLSISLFLWAMAFFRVVGCTVLFVTALSMTLLASWEAQWTWLLATIWAGSSANDLTITATLVLLLYKQRTHVVHTRTAALVDKLITWTIETGMLNSVLGIATLACFFTMENFIWLAMFSVTARLFANTLLASLNSRTKLRAMDQVTVTLPSFVSAIERTGTMTKATDITYEADLNSAPNNTAAREEVQEKDGREEDSV